MVRIGYTLSVLMAVYRREKASCLNQCFESLLEQTLPADEIILVKDGVLTRELELCIAEWQNKLPLVIAGYEENKGLAYALNYGLQYCAGDFIARMDSDDICMPNRFEQQIYFLKEHTDAAIIGANILEFFDECDTITNIGERKYPAFIGRQSRTLYRGTPLAHSTVMIQKELLEKYRYNTETSSNEDIDLWFRLLLDGYVIRNLNMSLLKYRITSNTFSRRNYKKALNEFKIYWNNLVKLHGFSLLLIFPLMRLIVRFLPARVLKKVYLSRQRQKMFVADR